MRIEAARAALQAALHKDPKWFERTPIAGDLHGDDLRLWIGGVTVLGNQVSARLISDGSQTVVQGHRGASWFLLGSFFFILVLLLAQPLVSLIGGQIRLNSTDLTQAFWPSALAGLVFLFHRVFSLFEAARLSVFLRQTIGAEPEGGDLLEGGA